MEEAACGFRPSDEAVAFVGETLGPLFMDDPATGVTDALFEALASLDVEEAAEAWPFVGADQVQEPLAVLAGQSAVPASEDVVWEYRRLFVGPGPKAAPQWGSVYTDRECVVFGESTLALRQWMRQRGVKRLIQNAEPEDSLGELLCLMAWLARHRPELVDELLADHVLPWAPHFLEEMEEAAEQPFYQALAQLARLTLEGIQVQRHLAVAAPRFYR